MFVVGVNHGFAELRLFVSSLFFQYFTDRMHQLVQLRYMHLLRWKRFLGHTKAIEQLYTDFSQRLRYEFDFGVFLSRWFALLLFCLHFELAGNHKLLIQIKIVSFSFDDGLAASTLLKS
jgi:hypothetical protein